MKGQANRYPDMKALSARVPDHPVLLRGLQGFAVWGNRLAFERAGITRATKAPVGGEIRTDSRGNPTGILINRAGALLEAAVPEPTPAQVEARMIAGLKALAAAGYVSVHEAGADSAAMAALETLEREHPQPTAEELEGKTIDADVVTTAVALPQARSAAGPAAAPAEAPKTDTPQGPAPAAQPGDTTLASAGQMNIVKARLASASLSSVDLKARWGFDLDALPKNKVNEVLDWIRNPVPAGS